MFANHMILKTFVFRNHEGLIYFNNIKNTIKLKERD